LDDREAGILRESRIRERAPAEVEDGSARRLDLAGVLAIRAQADGRAPSFRLRARGHASRIVLPQRNGERRQGWDEDARFLRRWSARKYTTKLEANTVPASLIFRVTAKESPAAPRSQINISPASAYLSEVLSLLYFAAARTADSRFRQ
jgi:hypothetical protein